MRTAVLTRNSLILDGTFGLWKSDSNFKCVTAERPKTADAHPCIPCGVYDCRPVVSPHFYSIGSDFGFGRGVVYEVKNVPGRTNILIHPANWPVPIKTDKDPVHLQLQGCIAPGSAVAKIKVPDPDGRMLTGVTSSRDATVALMRDMGGFSFRLIIKEIA